MGYKEISVDIFTFRAIFETNEQLYIDILKFYNKCKFFSKKSYQFIKMERVAISS